MNSKNKGNTFERKIANLLSKHFSSYLGIEQGFRRAIDSGSFFGGKNQRRVQTHDLNHATFGDIICPVNFKYSLECKHYKSPPTFSSLMKQDIKQWDEWIGQAKQDCLNSGKKMAVIIKYNNVPESVIIEEPLPNVTNIQYKCYYVVTLDDFLSQENEKFFH